MKVLLGSTSEQKITILKKALNDQDVEVCPFSVESGITDQPLDEETTVKGAINRAYNAAQMETDQDFDFSVGLEAGLVRIEGLYNLVCVAAIQDKAGTAFVGVSKKSPLPRVVSEAIENGEQFGEVVRKYEKTILNSESIELSNLIVELINREESFQEAIKIAYIQYKYSDSVFK